MRQVMRQHFPCWTLGLADEPHPRETKHVLPFDSLREMLGSTALDSLWKFAVVRNPWERMISWHMWQRKNRIVKPRSFEEFVLDLLKKRMPKSLQSNYFASPEWFDHVYRFEDLPTDWPLLRRRLGLPESAKLPHANASDHKHYSTYYRKIPGIRDTVGEAESRLLEKFPYEFREV